MALTDIQIRNAKTEDKQYKLSDSGGLYVLMHPNGSKYWRLKYRIAGKEKVLSLGTYPLVSLAIARDKATKAKEQLLNNIDPSIAKKEEKLQQVIEVENSFESVARCWHANHIQKWSEDHSARILKRLENDIFPHFGFKAIETIKAPELLVALRVIEARGALEVARRVLQVCGQVFRYAVMTGRAERDISTDLKGALKTQKKSNYAYLKESELPEFLSKLDRYDGDLQTKLALKFLILTFTRTSEVRGARWDEINFEKKEWRIPAERMKMDETHVVALSTQTIVLLKELQSFTGSYEHLFPNRNKPMTFMSENTMLYAIYRMGYHSRTTAHGFRATASTILNENGFAPDVIERQLAHAERNKIRASYNHAEYLPERRKMMQWWGNYIDGCCRA